MPLEGTTDDRDASGFPITSWRGRERARHQAGLRADGDTGRRARARANAKVRCYHQLGPEFKGFDAAAAWTDTRVGIEHLTRWERVAVVTDVEWLRFATGAFFFLMPGHVRVFSLAESDEAERWITAA